MSDTEPEASGEPETGARRLGIDAAALYRRTAAETAPPSQLVLMAYRRAVASARRGAAALDRGETAPAHAELVRAQGIVAELQAGLINDEGPLSASLTPLYDYYHRRLVEANVSKDPAPAREVADLMESLLEAWETALRPRSRYRWSMKARAEG